MHKVLLLGSGKIGRMIAKFLADTGDFAVTVADLDDAMLRRVAQRKGIGVARLDATDERALTAAATGQDTIISALSFGFNPLVARVAVAAGTSYFDLTEDVVTTRAVQEVARSAQAGRVFMPQCGLAPGFVSVVAHHLAQKFDSLDKVYMRVGALPQFPSNALKYNLTWSTDGLINEYCNPCEAIQDGVKCEVTPLEGLEHFSIDGVRYEAFNTSGGLGTLCDTLDGQVQDLNYKTIRYLGHRDLVAFLLSGLRLKQRRPLLKDLLEFAIPITFQDVVVTFCTVSGWRQGQLVQVTDARKIYNTQFDGETWSAIQVTTAAGICTMVDLHRGGRLPAGFVRQEQVSLEDFLNNRFGRHYGTHSNTPVQFSADGGGGVS